MSEDLPQAQFNGWARVEVMGHQTHIGYVRTEAYGAAVLFRIDTPELPEREWVLEKPEWDERGSLIPVGSKVKRAGSPGVSVLVGAGSIYRIVPCSEGAAKKAIENERRAALKVVELPAGLALAAAADSEEDLEDDDGEQERLRSYD
jgi:hypothetical protein